MCFPGKPFRVEKEWEHAGLKCAATQAFEGRHRCGYVRLPPGHKFYGMAPMKIPADAHGGVNFGALEPCEHEDGRGYWIGFDCAHVWDGMWDPNLVPDELGESTRGFFDALGPLREVEAIGGIMPHYWTHEDVVRETERLAEQLAESGYVIQ